MCPNGTHPTTGRRAAWVRGGANMVLRTVALCIAPREAPAWSPRHVSAWLVAHPHVAWVEVRHRGVTQGYVAREGDGTALPSLPAHVQTAELQPSLAPDWPFTDSALRIGRHPFLPEVERALLEATAQLLGVRPTAATPSAALGLSWLALALRRAWLTTHDARIERLRRQLAPRLLQWAREAIRAPPLWGAHVALARDRHLLDDARPLGVPDTLPFAALFPLDHAQDGHAWVELPHERVADAAACRERLAQRRLPLLAGRVRAPATHAAAWRLEAAAHAWLQAVLLGEHAGADALVATWTSPQHEMLVRLALRCAARCVPEAASIAGLVAQGAAPDPQTLPPCLRRQWEGPPAHLPDVARRALWASLLHCGVPVAALVQHWPSRLPRQYPGASAAVLAQHRRELESQWRYWARRVAGARFVPFSCQQLRRDGVAREGDCRVCDATYVGDLEDLANGRGCPRVRLARRRQQQQQPLQK